MQEYITQAPPDVAGRLGSLIGISIAPEAGPTTQQVRVSAAVTGAVSWRPEGVRYHKNEVFIDVIESVNLLVRPVACSLITLLHLVVHLLVLGFSLPMLTRFVHVLLQLRLDVLHAYDALRPNLSGSGTFPEAASARYN